MNCYLLSVLVLFFCLALIPANGQTTTASRPFTTTSSAPSSSIPAQPFIIFWTPFNGYNPESRILSAHGDRTAVGTKNFYLGRADFPDGRSQFVWVGEHLRVSSTDQCLTSYTDSVQVDVMDCDYTAANQKWRLRTIDSRRVLIELFGMCMRLRENDSGVSRSPCNTTDLNQHFILFPTNELTTTSTRTPTTSPPSINRWLVIFSFSGVNGGHGASIAPPLWNAAINEFIERFFIIPRSLNGSNFFYSLPTEEQAIEFIAFIIGRFDAQRRGSISAWKIFTPSTGQPPFLYV